MVVYARILVILFLGFIFSSKCLAQTPQQYFGEKYKVAIAFIKKHKTQIVAHFGKNDAAKAMAIVFPEMLRYNTLSNEAEIQVLRSFYIKLGKQYADFSIGYFQMKPSFVETLEAKLGKKVTDTPENREKRLDKLMSTEGQLGYLKDFWQIMKQLYPKLSEKKANEQVRFLASAYNYGFLAPETNILNWSTQKAFPSGKNSLVKFSYADIAEEFYTKEAPKIF